MSELHVWSEEVARRKRVELPFRRRSAHMDGNRQLQPTRRIEFLLRHIEFRADRLSRHWRHDAEGAAPGETQRKRCIPDHAAPRAAKVLERRQVHGLIRGRSSGWTKEEPTP